MSITYKLVASVAMAGMGLFGLVDYIVFYNQRQRSNQEFIEFSISPELSKNVVESMNFHINVVAIACLLLIVVGTIWFLFLTFSETDLRAEPQLGDARER